MVFMENENNEDLTYLTFANHKKHKNVQFLLAYVDFFFDSNPKLRQLSQLYIEEILVLMCKFGGYDYTILLQYARVITSRGWN